MTSVIATPEIAPAEIVQIGHPALRQGTRNVPEHLMGSAALRELIDVMRVTMTAGQGVGLAAPQIAVPLRMFVIEDDEEGMAQLSAEERERRQRFPFPFEAVINPIWRAASSQVTIEVEGCLSIPGLRAAVPRYWEIEVEGRRPDGQPKTWSLKGWPARIFQHEIDHLDGRLLTDCMLPRTLAVTGPTGAGVDRSLLERLTIA
jgi:peptide deformylase